jgi:hypothetical protein
MLLFYEIQSQKLEANSQQPLQFSRFLQPNVKKNNGQNKKHISFVFYKMFEKGNPKSYRQ